MKPFIILVALVTLGAIAGCTKPEDQVGKRPENEAKRGNVAAMQAAGKGGAPAGAPPAGSGPAKPPMQQSSGRTQMPD